MQRKLEFGHEHFEGENRNRGCSAIVDAGAGSPCAGVWSLTRIGGGATTVPKEMKPNTKTALFASLLAACGIAIVISGCVNGTPLASTPVGGALYNTQTNYTPVVSVVTNLVPVTVYHTNEVTQTVTNQVGVVQFVTNQVAVASATTQPQVFYVTNQVPQYVNTVKPAVTDAVQSAGGILSTMFPGGGAVAWALLALLGGAGYATSTKSSSANYSTATALSQEIETILAFMGKLPNGAVYTTALTSWLQSHQADAGVVQNVLGVLQNEVSNNDAQVAAQQLSQTIASLMSQTAPTPTAAPAPKA